MTRQTEAFRWAFPCTLVLLLGVLAFLTACEQNTPTVAATPECPECPELECPEPVSYEELWKSSAHADERADAFVHWDEDDPPVIPEDCAKCHSRHGFVDFLGVDGTRPGRVDQVAPVGTTLTCFVCHNEAVMDMYSVAFPSGIEIAPVGAAAPCMQCHQGRSSAGAVNAAISEAAVEDDEVSADLSYIDNHHAVAAATLLGAEVQGAYEYSGMAYHGRFVRGEEVFTCLDCHDNHSLELGSETCFDCHTVLTENIRDIRVDTTDYDGDGDVSEGIAYEIEGLQEALLAEIVMYARDTVGKPIVYESGAYPYFYIDTDGDGVTDPEEAVRDNRYDVWTPRLVRVVYNYLFVANDRGAYAHNPDYVLQVLYDSLADIGADVTTMARAN